MSLMFQMIAMRSIKQLILKSQMAHIIQSQFVRDGTAEHKIAEALSKCNWEIQKKNNILIEK